MQLTDDEMRMALFIKFTAFILSHSMFMLTGFMLGYLVFRSACGL